MPHIIKDKQNTSHALMDEIVYNCKLILKSIVLKDESTANANETKNSLANSEVLLSINNGTMTLDFFPLTVEYLVDFGYDEFTAFEYVQDPSLIPEEDRDNLLKFCCDKFTEEYVEENNYYRMLNGEPAYGHDEYDIYIKPYPEPGNFTNEDEERQKRYREKLVGVPIDQIFDFSKPLHEFTIYQISTLETLGIIDLIKEDFITNNTINPLEYRYLNYLGSKKIDYITARSAAQWDIIYMPHVNYYVLNRFKELFTINRDIYLRRSNQLAYNVDSDYYEQMLMFIIVCQTFNDMIVDTPEWYIRRDIIDLRSVQYFLESNGVEYFADIPLRYQTVIVKNLNKLIKYKSTTQNILDILAIFNSENTIIYKYYLMKRNLGTDYDPEIPPGTYPSTDDPEYQAWIHMTELDCGDEADLPAVISTGDGYGNDVLDIPENDINPVPRYDFIDDGTLPIYNYDFYNPDDEDATADGTASEAEDDYYESHVRKVRDEYGNVYGLEFVKVPIDQEYDEYVRDEMYHEGYDEVVLQDKYWDGQDSHALVRNNHCLKDFTVEGTKYMGLEFNVFIEQYSYQREYYLGLIFDGGVDVEDLKIAVPELKPDILFNVRDLLIFLYCCNGLYDDTSVKINNPLEALENRTEPQPPFQPYHDYDGGTYRYALPFIEEDGYYSNDKFPDMEELHELYPDMDYPDYQNKKFHEYMLGGEMRYASNITEDTFYDYIRTKHQDLFINLFGRIYGFNMNADLNKVAETIGFKHSKFGYERGYTLEELGVDTFITGRQVHTIQELYDIYENNTKCYKKLRSWFQNSSNRDERRVYDYVYYELFTTPYNQDFYILADGTMAETYDQVLMKYDYNLYMIYLDLKSEDDLEARRSILNDIVNSIIDTLNYYMNGTNLQYILTFVDNSSIDALLHYISEMINFFKSWKVYFLEPKTNYIIGDSGMYDDEDHRLSGASSPEYICTYGDQVGTYVERFWTVSNNRWTDSVIVKNHYYIDDQLMDNPNYNAEVVDIASHYVDHDILGDKDYNGYYPPTRQEQILMMNAGNPDENSFAPFYVYNGGDVAARKNTVDIEGGQSLDTMDSIEVDGGYVTDPDKRFQPVTTSRDQDVEKFFYVNGGWTTARQITDKTTVVTVDEGYCENVNDTRPSDQIPYSKNRISINARISPNEKNGIKVSDDGLFVNNNFTKSVELEQEYADEMEYKDSILEELKYWMSVVSAYSSISGLDSYINNEFAKKFAGATRVINTLSDPNYETDLLAEASAKVDGLLTWFDENNPFVWRDFDGNKVTN